MPAVTMLRPLCTTLHTPFGRCFCLAVHPDLPPLRHVPLGRSYLGLTCSSAKLCQPGGTRPGSVSTAAM